MLVVWGRKMGVGVREEEKCCVRKTYVFQLRGYRRQRQLVQHVSVIFNFSLFKQGKGNQTFETSTVFLEFVVKSTTSTRSGVFWFASYRYSHNVFLVILLDTRRTRNLQALSDKYFNHFLVAHFHVSQFHTIVRHDTTVRQLLRPW